MELKFAFFNLIATTKLIFSNLNRIENVIIKILLPDYFFRIDFETIVLEGIWALINCAESYAVAEVEWFSCDDFEKIMQINFLGTVRLTKAVLPLLRKTKGRIVNLSNLSGKIVMIKLRYCIYKNIFTNQEVFGKNVLIKLFWRCDILAFRSFGVRVTSCFTN